MKNRVHIVPLTVETFREFIHYDPETGVFTWIKDKGTARAGDVAGAVSEANGYRQLCFAGLKLGAHRFVFFYQNGEFPKGYIDHIDGDKTNNRRSNLRLVSNKLNCENRKRAQVNNKLGVLGVTKSCSRYAATIKHHGKKIWIGTFDTPEEAHQAYLEKKREIHAGNTL